MELLDQIFFLLNDWIIAPLLRLLTWLLSVMATPISGLSPITQTLIVALVAAVISLLLSIRFSSKKERQLKQRFDKRLSSMKNTGGISDKKTRTVVRKEISQQADQVFEQMILDKFIAMGIYYFTPMFFFLIWLEYDLFTPEYLQAQTGSRYLYDSGSGGGLTAAYCFLWGFNGFLLVLHLAKAGLRFAIKRVRLIRQSPGSNGQVNTSGELSTS